MQLDNVQKGAKVICFATCATAVPLSLLHMTGSLLSHSLDTS